MASFPVLLVRRRLATLLAVLVYGAGFLVGYLLMRNSRAWHCGEPYCFWHRGAWEAWFSLPVLPAALAWLLTWRALNGPSVAREELALSFAGSSEELRNGEPRLAMLVDQLRALGYQPWLFVMGPWARPDRVASENEPLLGADLVIIESASVVKRGHLRLLLSRGQGGGRGLLEIVDSKPAVYTELGFFVLRALAELFPSLTFRRLHSQLTPTPAKELTWENPGDYPDPLTLARRTHKPLVPTQIPARNLPARF
jgi:hypothetical protein